MNPSVTPPSLDIDLRELFASTGPLARALPGYRVRSEQIEMSLAILQAMAEGRSVVVEAGTGVGKTAAYLVPAMLAVPGKAAYRPPYCNMLGFPVKLHGICDSWTSKSGETLE